VLDVIIMIGICFGAPVLLALVFSGKWKERTAWFWGILATVTVLVNVIVVGVVGPALPHFAFTEGLEWNWYGKVATIAATLIIFACLPKALKTETGILNIPKTDNWPQLLSVCALFLIFFWGFSYLTRDGTSATTEYYVFQTFMPSIDEEFAFRGTILAMLVAAFGKPYAFAGIKIGWGALPIVAVFGLVHGYSILLEGGVINYVDVAATIFITGAAGVLLFWIKEKTASVWICVVMHSLMNVGNGYVNGFSI
jgi:uncharacterized protein